MTSEDLQPPRRTKCDSVTHLYYNEMKYKVTPYHNINHCVLKLSSLVNGDLWCVPKRVRTVPTYALGIDTILSQVMYKID